MEIHDNLLETLGNTPLVALTRFAPGPATLVAKLVHELETKEEQMAQIRSALGFK